MNMGDKDVSQLIERQPGTAHLQLGTLATVDHEQLAVAFHHLHGREMAQSGQRASTS
jgi:hypothetical protein